MRGWWKTVNYVGMRFGLLRVVRDQWRDRCRCVCDCGKAVTVFKAHLRDGHTKSCGCLRRLNLGRPHFKLDPARVDWTRDNVAIAYEHGVTRQAVSLVRLRLEKEGKLKYDARFHDNHRPRRGHL